MLDSPPTPASCPSDPNGDTLLHFTPAPLDRTRHDGWTPERQRQFITALREMGSVGFAAKAVSMGRVSAYALRKRAGAEGFARAWDRALHQGRQRIFDLAMERAMDGVTTIRVHKGGSVHVAGGPDMRMITAGLREAPGADRYYFASGRPE